MKKRILSCLMALALCLTLLPTAALAEEPEGTAQTSPAVEESTDPANGEAKQENQPVEAKQEGQPAAPEQEGQSAEQEEQQEDSAAKQDVAAVQAMIDALPDAAKLDGMDDEDAMAVYEAFQAACEAYYDTLTEGQREQLKNTEKLEALSDWFSQSAALAAGTEHQHPICGDKDCSDHVESFSDWKGVNTLAAEMEAGHYYLTDYVTIYSTWKPQNGVVLCLNGYGITLDADGPVIEVQPGVTFTLCDCKGSGNRGSITHNRRMSRYGIGVLVGASDSVKNDAVFNMYGGTISGNEAPEDDEADGGGVTVAGGTFNMYGGTISNNMAYSGKGIGGGVFVGSLGTFNMSGGTITGNMAKSGGGVFVGGYCGKNKGDDAKYGGTFNMSGGEITSNTTGGGVYVNYYPGAIFKVSGAAKITGNTAKNVYLSKGTIGGNKTFATPIEVDGTPLTGSIGVTTAEEGQTVAEGVSAAAKKCFTCDDSSNYRLKYDSDASTLTMIAAAHSKHPVCGDVNCNEHTKLTDWQSVDDLSKIDEAGNYYLTQDIDVKTKDPWTPVTGVVLCLNGYSITYAGESVNSAISVKSGVTFTLCDCVGTGEITHGPDTNSPAHRRSGSGVAVEGTFIMYGGSITGNETYFSYSGGGVWVMRGGAFEMHGGAITNNVAYLADGGGVRVYGGGTFTMTGGEITGNTATSGSASGQNGYGGGVYANGTDSVVKISGSAKIYDNKHGEGTAASGGTNHVTNNVCLPSDKTIQIVGALEPEASIGVTSTKTLSATEPVTVATLAEGVTYTPGSIFSDLGVPSGVLLEDGKVNLYSAIPHKHPICGAKHKDINGHKDACGDVNWKPWDGTSEIVYDSNKTAYVYLTGNAERDSALTVAEGYTLYLCLNGKSITKNKSDSVIIVGYNATFSLCDCQREQGSITHGTGTNGKYEGHGVNLGASATFNMYGGSITGNKADIGGGVELGYQQYNSKFNMYGGSITNNVANNGDGGGGVHILAGTFTMYGGSITGNKADTNYGGGGVYLGNTIGKFVMKGGSITNNTAKNGGGVYVYDNGLTVTGDVTITGNKNTDNEDENVYLRNDRYSIDIGTDGLGENASIGVTTANSIAEGGYVKVATGANKGYTKGTIFGDKTEYTSRQKGDEVRLYNGLPHEHAVCGKTGCTEHTGHSDVVWLPLTSTDGKLYYNGVAVGSDTVDSILRYTLPAGNYYLSGNVTINGYIEIGGDVNLCLKGNTITTTAALTESGQALIEGYGKNLTICDCSASGSGTIRVSSGTNCVVLTSGALTMYGGKITGGKYGVYLYNVGGTTGTFNMYGGTITGNGTGVGRYEKANTLTFGGDAKIKDNTNKINVSLLKTGTITIDASLTQDARIGVYFTQKPADTEKKQFASGANNKALDYAAIFSCDNSKDYVLTKDDNGNLFFGKHQHSWTYALKADTTDTITATCKDTTCANRDGGSVRISASDATYDRSAKAATVTASDDWKGDAANSIAVKYIDRNGTDYDSTSAPTDAGTYTASITLKGADGQTATASVEYTILQAYLQPPDLSGLTAVYGNTLADVKLPKGCTWEDNTTQSVGAVGVNTFKATYTPSDPNYKVVRNIDATVTVSKAPVTINITGMPAGPITYGDTFTLTASQTGDTTDTNKKWTWDYDHEHFSPVSENTNSNSITLQAIKAGAPSKNITATYESDTHKDSAPMNSSVAQKEVTVTAGSYKVSKTYDGTTNVGTASGTLNVTGILSADSGVTVKVTPVAYTSADVGRQSSMNVNIALDGTGKDNYKIKDDANTVSVPCEITAKALTISSATAISRGYVQNDKSVGISGVTFTGASLAKNADYTVTGEMDNANAGIDKNVNVTVTLTGSATANYTLTSNTTTTKVTIHQIDPTTPTGLTGLKDQALSTVPLSDGWTWDAPSTTMSTLGNQIFKASYASSTNYKAKANVDVTVTVSDKDTVTISGLTAALELTYNGFVQTGYTGTPSYSPAWSGIPVVTYYLNDGTTKTTTANSGAVGEGQAPKNAGNYKVTIAIPDSDPTYIGHVTLDFAIAKRTISVKADNKSMTANGTLPTFTVTYGNFASGDSEATVIETKATAFCTADGTSTGSFPITVSGTTALKSGMDTNYEVGTPESGTLTVSTRPSSGGGGSSSGGGSSGGGGGSSRPSTHPVKAEVSKDPDGSVSLSKTSAAKGDKVTITVKPDRHYEVDEVIVRDSKGKQLAVKDNGDGTFTFEMPADKVTVEPTFSWVNPFADVADSAYYVDAVEWMLKRELTQGTTETTFGPDLNCTRAQIVTFLWRAAGSPEAKGTVSFADVSTGSYYAKAVAWAIENGITGGTGDGLFSPDATCTRAQSAAFLYRAAGSPAVNGSAGFSDVAADAYYAQAVAWAKEHGITDGIGGGLFGSANDCTRAQIAAFLYRYMK